MLLLLASLSQAAIVNVLQPQVGPPDPGRAVSMKVGGTLLEGNEQRLSVNGALGAQFVGQEHRVLLRVSGERAVAFDTVIADKAFVHARETWAFSDPWATVLFVQSDRNAFRDLQLRALGGGGLERRLFRTDWSEGTLGVGAMGEYQLLDADAVDSDAGWHPRGNSYLVLAISHEDGVELASTTFYQPRLDAWSNWRLAEELSLTLEVSEHLDWSVVGKLQVDSQPVQGNESYDLSVVSGLVLSF